MNGLFLVSDLRFKVAKRRFRKKFGRNQNSKLIDSIAMLSKTRSSLLLSLFLLACVCLFVSHKPAQANYEIPQQFSDEFVPESRRKGPEVGVLGRVTLLPGYERSALSVEALTARFYIQANGYEQIVVPFEHSREYASGNGTSNKIPYELQKLHYGSFNGKRKTIILIPGYRSHDSEAYMTAAKEKWFALEDVNVIYVSWADFNKSIYYTTIAQTPLLARQITMLLYYLATIDHKDPQSDEFTKSIHLVGHSLGAHISGFVGKDFNGKLGRITALDPAGPVFDQMSPANRLDRSDARLVEAFHTNAGVMKTVNMAAASAVKLAEYVGYLPYVRDYAESIRNEYGGEADTAWFGLDADVGHLDYYVNNGRIQPGCSGLFHICDHMRGVWILSDMLDYELALKRANITKDKRLAKRLRAFDSNDYESFLAGSNFELYCPKLMSMDEHLSKEAIESLTACSVPIDLLSPIDELIEEMKTKYKIKLDLEGDSNLITSRRLFFKTASKDAFVGEHYLLKLYLTHEPIWDAAQCTLEAKLNFGDQQSIINTEVRSIANNTFPQTIAMPFVRTNRNISEQIKLGNDSEDYKRSILPEKLDLIINDTKAKGIIDTVSNKVTKMWNQDSTRNCLLHIGMVEVHPVLVSEGKNFAGIYGFDESVIDTTGKNALHIYSMEHQSKIPWLDERISRLSSDSLLQTSRKLIALVDGQ